MRPHGVHVRLFSGSIGPNDGGVLDLEQRRKENFPGHLLQRVGRACLKMAEV